MRVLMVCLGNICRSPLAQGILESKVAELGLAWEVDSAGTSSWHIGEGPDKRSVATAKNHGIDISNQKARQFTIEDFSSFDLILAMDSSNYQDIIASSLDKAHESMVKLILNYSWPNENRAVPDPYWDGNFEKVYALLDTACDKLIEENTEK
jgi:protein-tyrosine phosphatase